MLSLGIEVSLIFTGYHQASRSTTMYHQSITAITTNDDVLTLMILRNRGLNPKRIKISDTTQ